MSSAAPLKEVGLIALLALALFTMLALFSYSPMDPGVVAARHGSDRSTISSAAAARGSPTVCFRCSA